MKEKKGLYPDRSVYTQQIGPGLCFGALALMLRFFFEVLGGGQGRGFPHLWHPRRQAERASGLRPSLLGIWGQDRPAWAGQ